MNHVKLVDLTNPLDPIDLRNLEEFENYVIGPKEPHRPFTFLDYPTIWFNCSGLVIRLLNNIARCNLIDTKYHQMAF